MILANDQEGRKTWVRFLFSRPIYQLLSDLAPLARLLGGVSGPETHPKPQIPKNKRGYTLRENHTRETNAPSSNLHVGLRAPACKFPSPTAHACGPPYRRPLSQVHA